MGGGYPIPEISWLVPTFCCALSQISFGTPSTKIIYNIMLYYKIFFSQTLVEIIFRYHKKYFRPKIKWFKQKKFHILITGRMEFISEENVGKYFKIKMLVCKKLLRLIFWTEFFLKKIRVDKVYIEDSFDTTFNFNINNCIVRPIENVYVGKISHGGKG